MASTYGIITVADLEGYSGRDYSNIDATKYTDAFIEKKITLAERAVRAYTFTAYTSANATDGVIAATLEISSRLMYNQLVVDKYLVETEPVLIWDPLIETLLESSKYSPVDLIPMQGVDR